MPATGNTASTDNTVTPAAQAPEQQAELDDDSAGEPAESTQEPEAVKALA